MFSFDGWQDLAIVFPPPNDDDVLKSVSRLPGAVSLFPSLAGAVALKARPLQCQQVRRLTVTQLGRESPRVSTQHRKQSEVKAKRCRSGIK